VLAWRLAAEQFVVRGVSRTSDRSGILIFVARAERYARIVADEGIARQVPAAQWRAAMEALVAHMREDRVADGFIVAIVACTNILKACRPPAAERPNALANRAYLPQGGHRSGFLPSRIEPKADLVARWGNPGRTSASWPGPWESRPATRHQ
jgi:hypothetical protein